jgi:hypothetical protein
MKPISELTLDEWRVAYQRAFRAAGLQDEAQPAGGEG